jgi:hypothetical protein
MPNMSGSIANALRIRGGGNSEAWVITQYLLSIRSDELENIDYYRELPVGAARKGRKLVDLAFNVQYIYDGCPPILTEWKCRPTDNDLSVDFFSDVNKFATLLPACVGPEAPKPYPVWVGIGPLRKNLGSGVEAHDIGNGVGLFLSTVETWKVHNLIQYTAYGQYDPAQPATAGALTVSI